MHFKHLVVMMRTTFFLSSNETRWDMGGLEFAQSTCQLSKTLMKLWLFLCVWKWIHSQGTFNQQCVANEAICAFHRFDVWFDIRRARAVLNQPQRDTLWMDHKSIACRSVPTSWSVRGRSFANLIYFYIFLRILFFSRTKRRVCNLLAHVLISVC